jgi:CheY-like chemotaxis protein
VAAISVEVKRKALGLADAQIDARADLGKRTFIAGLRSPPRPTLRRFAKRDKAPRVRECRWAARLFGAIMKISPGDLTDPRVVDLLQHHLTSARAHTAPGSTHALDIGGLQAFNVTFWTAWDRDTLVAVGALKPFWDFRRYEISSSLASTADHPRRAGTKEMTWDALPRAFHAASAASALRLLDEHPEIRLLFTDIVMPDMNGRALADEALHRCPTLKVLFTTGFTRNAIIHNGIVDPGVHFLAKPFTLEMLASKLRGVLDPPGTK